MQQEIPMTEAMYYLLLALLQPAHGYNLMQQVKQVSNGRVCMGPGTLYGLLGKLTKAGLIVLQQEDERRKTYSLTPQGKQALIREYQRIQVLIEDGKRAGVELL